MCKRYPHIYCMRKILFVHVLKRIWLSRTWNTCYPISQRLRRSIRCPPEQKMMLSSCNNRNTITSQGKARKWMRCAMVLDRRSLIEFGHDLHNKNLGCVAIQNLEGTGQSDQNLRHRPVLHFFTTTTTSDRNPRTADPRATVLKV